MWIPESPRWLVTHGHGDRAEVAVAGIEERVRAHGHLLPPIVGARVRLRARANTPIVEVVVVLFRTFRARTLVGLSLMTAQAFFYNAIFFTYALILTNFYGVPSAHVGWYILPFALGNVLGPILLGRLFDTVGRKTMIASTYALSGLLLAVTASLFSRDLLTAQTLTIAWMIVFFFASAAASSAYLTVSEIFPLEIRALAIAFFYAIGTGIGGHRRAGCARYADQYRLAGERRYRLSHRRHLDDWGRFGRSMLRRGCRTPTAGISGAAAGPGRVTAKVA